MGTRALAAVAALLSTLSATPGAALAAAAAPPTPPPPPPPPPPTTTTPTRLEAHAFNLSAVRLVADAGNHFQQAQALNTEFLQYLDPNRFLVAWRMVAGLRPLRGAVPYGGWMKLGPKEHTDMGHFTGHYLSATAFTIAATDDPMVTQKSAHLVGEIAACQDAICAANASLCGYVDAVPVALLVAFEEHKHYDAVHDSSHVIPYYGIHKVMAGLLDTFEQADNALAFSVLLKMASFFKKRIDDVIATKGIEWWETCLLQEFGGMNELAYNLYSITGDEEHKQLGDYFYKVSFMDPIARSDEYALTSYHANTHLAQVIGVARGWEVAGNATLRYITTEFMRILTAHYTYAATGGSNQHEHWVYPDQLGAAVATHPASDSPGYHTEESCTQYNVLKLVRHLFFWAPSAALADDYEHKINNGVLGIQAAGEVGAILYMTPLGNGVSKPLANWHEENGGFGGRNDSFWCCYGTGIESFAKLGDSIYFHGGITNSAAGHNLHKPQLWINQYVSSTLKDEGHGLTLTQSVSNVRASSGSKNNALQTKITIGRLNGAAAITDDLTISLRIPGWADAAVTTVTLNGQPLVEPGTCQVSTFLHVKRNSWKAGDVLAASFGMRPRFVKLNDIRDSYNTVGSLHYGPYLLAGMSNGSSAVQAGAADIDSWLTLDAASSAAAAHELSFTAKGAGTDSVFKLLPLNRVVDEVYTVHFNVSKDAKQIPSFQLPEFPPRSSRLELHNSMA